MSNASAAREPSMDEILASIRRIIETGDERPGIGPAARKPAEFAAAKSAAEGLAEAAKAPVEPGFAGRPAGEGARTPGAAAAGEGPARAPAGEAAAAKPARADRRLSDPVLPAARPSEQVAAAQAVPDELRPSLAGDPDEATRSVASLRAVQPTAAEGTAAVRPAAAERPQARPEAAPAAHGAHRNAEISRRDEERPAGPEGKDEPLRQSAKVVDMRSFNLELDETEFAAELLSETGLGWSDAAASAAGHADPSLSRAEAPEPAARAADVEKPAARRFDNDPEADRPRPFCRYETEFDDTETTPLLSSSAGRQVAAAFDDLSEAIRLGQMKSMEEMAREMLRPMLQEWLDDNLPRLVERLVREEIERVARGGGR